MLKRARSPLAREERKEKFLLNDLLPACARARPRRVLSRPPAAFSVRCVVYSDGSFANNREKVFVKG